MVFSKEFFQGFTKGFSDNASAAINTYLSEDRQEAREVAKDDIDFVRQDSARYNTEYQSYRKEMKDLLGKVDNDTPTQTPEQDIEQTYLKLKGYLKRNSIFKTYFLRKCRKNRVFLENKYQSLNSLQVKGVSEKISKEKKTLNILEQNLED